MDSNQVTGWDLIQLTLIHQLRTGLVFNFADNPLSAIKTAIKGIFSWYTNSSEIG